MIAEAKLQESLSTIEKNLNQTLEEAATGIQNTVILKSICITIL